MELQDRPIVTGASICPECGTPLMGEARRGVCPGCFARRALNPPPAEMDSSDDSPGNIHSLQPEGAGAARPLREFGDYELIEEIGHGGMGVIFKARQRSLDRTVALKLIRSGSLARPGDIARFRTEAAAAARLQHPHIVAIYEVGEHEGQHFYSMEFVPGHSLARELQAGPLAPGEAARLLLAIAGAIQFAHEKGVLHRDLKPANILLDAEREPRVADFGLAKILQHDSELTVSGMVLGSPQFMPPEQARGRSAQAGARSDVYSLGAVLYNLLTGHPPFSAATALETIKLVAEREPIWPRVLNPSIPRDLETICLKCLAKEPSARYSSAAELAGELARFLRQEPIHARPVSRVERGWRWCRRKPALAALGLVLTLAPAIIISVLLVMGARVALERNHARSQAETLRENLYAADIYLAQHALEDGNLALAHTVLEEHLPRGNNPTKPGPPASTLATRYPTTDPSVATDLRGFEWRYLWARSQGDQVAVLNGHTGAVTCLAFSPDGKTLVSGSSDQTFRLWNLPDGTCRQVVPATARQPVPSSLRPWLALGDLLGGPPIPHEVLSASFSANGKSLAIGTTTSLIVWDVHAQDILTCLEASFARAVFSPTGTRFAVGSGLASSTDSGSTSLYDLDDHPTHQFGLPQRFKLENAGGALAFSADGQTLLTAPASQDLKVWDVGTGQLLKSIGGTAGTYRAAFSPDGRWLAISFHWTNCVRLAQTKDFDFQELPADAKSCNEPIQHLAFSPDSKTLATAGSDHSVRLWDVASRNQLVRFLGHGAIVNAVAFSPDGSLLASVSDDQTIRLWDPARRMRADVLTNAIGPILVSPDGAKLATRAQHQLIILWNLRTLKGSPIANTKAMLPIGFSADRTSLLATRPEADGLLHLHHLDLATLQDQRAVPLLQKDGPSSFQALSGDGHLFALGRKGEVTLWNPTTGQKLATLGPLDRPFDITALAFSPDGRTMADGTWPCVVRLWDLPSGQLRTTLPNDEAIRAGFAFSPHSRLLATTGSSRTIRLWNVATGREEFALHGHKQQVEQVAFSPDGLTLATGSRDGTLRLWSLTTRREMATLEHEFVPSWVGFTPDGRYLLATELPDRLHVYSAPTLAELGEAAGN